MKKQHPCWEKAKRSENLFGSGRAVSVLVGALSVFFLSACDGGPGDGKGGFSCCDGTSPVRVMSFNVLCPVCDLRDYPPWNERLSYFREIFERLGPDLVGTQELMSPGNVNQILELLPGHDVVRLTEAESGEERLSYPDSMIFYRKDRFVLIESGTYWLSQNPDVSFFPAWEPFSLPRVVLWAHFEDTVNCVDFVFINTHFDNNSGNKVPSAELLIERTAPFVNLPIVVAGDFNSRPDSDSYGVLVGRLGQESPLFLRDTFDLASPWRYESNTLSDQGYGCQGLVPNDFPACRIDHVFVGGNASWRVDDWVVDLWTYGEPAGFPSDHRAILAALRVGGM